MEESLKSSANSAVKGRPGTVSVETTFSAGNLRGAPSVEWMSGGVVKVLVCGVVRVEVVLIFGSTCFGARKETGKIINTVQSSVVRRTDSYLSMHVCKKVLLTLDIKNIQRNKILNRCFQMNDRVFIDVNRSVGGSIDCTYTKPFFGLPLFTSDNFFCWFQMFDFQLTRHVCRDKYITMIIIHQNKRSKEFIFV